MVLPLTKDFGEHPDQISKRVQEATPINSAGWFHRYCKLTTPRPKSSQSGNKSRRPQQPPTPFALVLSDMKTPCPVCTRLLAESNDALKAHTRILGQILQVSKDHSAMRELKREPRVRVAAERRKRTRQAYEDHKATCR